MLIFTELRLEYHSDKITKEHKKRRNTVASAADVIRSSSVFSEKKKTDKKYVAVLSCFVHFLKSKVQGTGKIQFEKEGQPPAFEVWKKHYWNGRKETRSYIFPLF